MQGGSRRISREVDWGTDFLGGAMARHILAIAALRLLKGVLDGGASTYPTLSAPKLLKAGLLATSTLVVGVAPAQPSDSPAGADSMTSPKEPARLLVELRAIRGDLPVGDVGPSPVPGIWRVELSGGNVVYGTGDGSFLFAGDLYAIDNGLVNLTERVRERRRGKLISEAAPDSMISFWSHSTTSDSIYVFTDVDCPHCRAFHQEIQELNDRGVSVHYIAFPRAGVGSETYRRMVSAWCASDPRMAIGELMSGSALPDRQCENPVAAHHRLARQAGLVGTPGIVAPDGRLLGGHIPPKELVAALRAPQRVMAKP